MFLVPTKPQRPEPCLPGSHLTKPERQKARDQFNLCYREGVCITHVTRSSLSSVEAPKSPERSDLLDSIHKSLAAGLFCSLLPDMKGHAFDGGEDAFIVSQLTLLYLFI